jgi:hypothetical protein
VRKGVLYSTVMQLVTLPIQAWATRAHLGTIRGYLLVMCGLGSSTVYVGAWLLLQDFAMQLRVFAGAFFCLVAGAQLSLSARDWLDARAKAAAATSGGGAGGGGGGAADWAAVAAPAPDGSAAGGAASPADGNANAASPVKELAAASLFAGSDSAESGDGSRLVVAPTAAPGALAAAAAAAAAAAPPPPPRGAAALFFASERGLAWFPPVSPVLSPLPLLSVLAFASLCAGVLNGMLGAGGPPLMLAYSFLELDKDVLRGFGVVPSIFMVLRMILYVAVPNGVFDTQEVLVYLLIGVASAGGSAAGGRLRASCSATALLRAILGLVWLSGWSMLGAFSDALPAGLAGASTILWLLLFAAAARWPAEFRAARLRVCSRAAAPR